MIREVNMNRGVITLAGGLKYFINAYVSIRMVRHLGCNLPIEWFYLGDEMQPEWIKLVESIPNVKCVDLGNLNKDNTKENGGWQNKINAILESSFDEVLFLDADNFVWRNPEYLFEDKEYKKTGAILWKDISDWEKSSNSAYESYFGCTPISQECCESGQLLFNKNKVKKALLKAKEYNEDSANSYEIVYGDKDTFYFAFIATNTPFYFMNKRPSIGYNCLHQYDSNNNIIFSHLTGGKWSLNGRPFITKESYPYVNECVNYIKELKQYLE